MDESDEEGRDGRTEVVVDGERESVAESVRSQSLALIQAIGLEDAFVGGPTLDVGVGGEVVVGEEVKREEIDIVMRESLVEMQDACVSSEARDGGVSVLNVKFNMGEGRRPKIIMELMSTRSGVETGRDHAVLMKASIGVPQNWSELATKITGDDAASDRMASQRTGSGGVESVRWQLFSLFVRFDFSPEGFGREETPVRGSHARMGESMKPGCDPGKRIGTRK